MQAGGSETPRSNPCQFSTFKSSPSGRAASDPASLDLAGLNLGHRETMAPSRAAEFNSSTLRERSPNASSRQLDKLSYFFHGHKTEKDIDREAVVFVSNRPDYPLTYFGRLVKEMGGAEHEEKKQMGSTLDGRRLTRERESRRDSGNVEFLDKAGEIFKKSSNELLQEASTKKKRNISFNNKERTHRSLESLEKSVDLSVADWKRSLDMFEYWPATVFYDKPRTVDFSQKTKKSRKRPNFLQRIRRIWHSVLKRRRIRRQIKYERSQSAQEKCEYFLQKFMENDFFERFPSLPVARPPAETNVFLFCKRDAGNDDPDSGEQKEVAAQLEENTFRVKDEEEDGSLNVNTDASVKQQEVSSPSAESQSARHSEENTANNVESIETKLLDTVPNVAAQEPACSNKDSMEVGYSVSELGKLCLQNLQSSSCTDVLHPREVDGAEWIVRADVDALSHGATSSASLGYEKLQGNFDILMGILLDMFVCTCM
ncbi:uncharacterized protein LOC143371737 isoform X2 [Andrena cerasifolii]|uniref:uncharacterized protein LOC143371737 isoform X2 n=1 Tax=Andrena cerasifolii TaxID=2819439 RepID=UPI00403837C7